MSSNISGTPGEITHSEENGIHRFETAFAGVALVVETGRYAEQAGAACTIQYGDTVMLATATMSSRAREGIDYFPLMVDFDEKLYAAGKIKGSRFIKREGRPSDEAILSGRIIDRSIRPFFDSDTRNDVQVVTMTLSWDGENDPDTIATLSASTAVHMSDIPWDGPVAIIRMSRINDAWKVNPTYEEMESSLANLLVAVREDKAVMIEAEGKEAPEDIVIEGIEKAITEAQPLLALMNKVRETVGKEKKDLVAELSDEQQAKQASLREMVESTVGAGITAAFKETDQVKRNEQLDVLKTQLAEKVSADESLETTDRVVIETYLEKLIKKATKSIYLNDQRRLDGRNFDEIRPLHSHVGLLPRTHGSGLFQRGQTQALTVLTLGSPSDQQILDTLEQNDTKKRYMHHYNFPAFSVGEVRPNRGPGRREIGHGALAEKALEPVIPDAETFPYTIRLVSEIMSSNGSSSMAATCGSTLALMDGGVPLKKPVAGIAMGILTDDDRPTEEYRVLTDIQGAEDHYGEMDFKIAGTEDGITAIQLDVKNTGLNAKMAAETILQAKTARMEILSVMKNAIPEPRAEMSQYAPRIITLRIDPEKIGDVIGPKGKIINGIIEETGVAIDIEDDGLVMITSTDAAASEIAQKKISDITRELVAGEVFDGTVTRIMDFGAFVEILPGREGLVHISELAPVHIGKVTDVVQMGDKIPVKLIEIDSEGRINLSLKQTDYQFPPEVLAQAQRQPERGNGPGGGRFDRKPHGGRRNGPGSRSSGPRRPRN